MNYRAALLLAFIGFFLGVPGPAMAQEPEPTPSQETAEVPPGLASPKMTAETFLRAMASAGPLRLDLYGTARSTLDLSELPVSVRDVQGNLLADELYAILKAAELDPDALPDRDYDRETYRLYRQPSGDEVVLVRHASGAWTFSAATVAALPRMYEVLMGKGKIDASMIPDQLQLEVLGLRLWQWLGLVLLPILAWVVGRVVLLLLRRGLRNWLKSETFGIEESEQRRVLRPVGWLVGALFWWAALSSLKLPVQLLVLLVLLGKFLAATAGVATAYRMADTFALYVGTLTAKTETKFDDMLVPLARRVLKACITVIGMLFIAQNLDLNVWSLFAGFSVVGAMIALAGKDMVSNLFGSLTVILDRPFSVGDWIVASGVEGTVEDVGFRSVRIRTFYNSLISLPNSAFITASVDNYGVRQYRRYSKKLNIRFDTPTEKIEAFCEGMRELVRQHKYTRKDYYHIYVNDVSDFGFQIMLYVFWECPDWGIELQERHRLLVDIHRLAQSLGVEFATPTNMVNLRQWEAPQPGEDDFSVQKAKLAHEQGRELGRELVESCR